jgi:Tol biopolymer transport system component
MPFSVSPDGRYIAYMKNEPKSNTGWDIWALPTFGDKSGDGKPFSVISTNFTDVVPVFSPDGKWLAYSNNETGRYEVYIQPFPGGAGRWQVSTAGGSNAVWRKDGKELFFQSLDQQIMAVDIHENGAGLELGAPHALFKAATVNNGNGPYTVSADGKKFVMNTVLPQSITEPLTLITNWTADLKQ